MLGVLYGIRLDLDVSTTHTVFFRFVVSIRSKNFGLRHAPFDRKNLVTFTFRGYLQALQRGTKRSSLAIGQHFQDFSFRGVCFSMLQKEWINVGRLIEEAIKLSVHFCFCEL